jgi:putative nucleotidyltransferase with HDIG domain
MQSRLGIDAAAVRLLNPQTQILEYVAGQGFRSTVTVGQQSDHCLEGACAECTVQQCRPLYIPDIRQSRNERLLSAFVNEGFFTYYRIPLILKDQIKGVLELFHRSRLTLDHGWRDFLDTLAGQASIAINNKELFNRLQEANAQITTAYDATIASLVRALELRDAETEGHSRRVTEMTLRLAQTLGVRDADLEDMRRGAILHDIGKIAVPDHILLKPGPLTAEEWHIMRQHPVTAYRMLAPIPFLQAALTIPYAHHEKWDGTGYPQGLQGEAIPLAARIFAVVDVWDALRFDRPYRKGWTEAQVCAYLQEQAGHHFDSQVVAAFLHIIGCHHESPRQMCIEACSEQWSIDKIF